MRPRWQWRMSDESGVGLDRPASPVFEARYDAEEWLGEHWRSLASQGVRGAQLLQEGEPVGPSVAIPV